MSIVALLRSLLEPRQPPINLCTGSSTLVFKPSRQICVAHGPDAVGVGNDLRFLGACTIIKFHIIRIAAHANAFSTIYAKYSVMKSRLPSPFIDIAIFISFPIVLHASFSSGGPSKAVQYWPYRSRLNGLMCLQ